MHKKRERLVDAAALLIISGFILSYFTPELLLSPTTAAGGDMGSHHYLAQFMQQQLAQGRITGWSHDWYAGLPMFQFYFPLAYVLMALLGALVHANVAFKLVTVLGTLLMPVCAYAAFRILGFRFPAPAIAAAFTLPFLFLQSNSMYGGNIPSTLAGEFSFSISMALMLVFAASLHQGMKKRTRIAFNTIVLAASALFHIIPIITVALASFALLRRRNARYLLLVYGGAFLLVGFWSIPFIAKFDYALSTGYTSSIETKDILPDGFSYLLPLTALGMALAWRARDRRILFFSLILVVAFALFLLMPRGHVWNTRFLPWYYLMAALIAGYGASAVAARVWRRRLLLVPLFICIAVIALVHNYVTYIDDWIRWNYSGFEAKPQWQTFREMNSYLNELPYGKVLHEYSGTHDGIFGTPRAFELIPYFTNKPGMEGLLIESSASSPFYFYLQSELSETATCPVSTFRCTTFNVDAAVPHLDLFNVKYIAATTERLKGALSRNANFTLLKKVNSIWIYEVARDNAYVAPLRYEPVTAERTRWRELSSDWIRSGSDVTVIYDTALPYPRIERVEQIARTPAPPCTVSELLNGDEEILVSTDCIGRPLLVKVTYSPNWQADGATVHLATPSFFVIIPHQSNVRIHYSPVAADWLGALATLVMLFILVNMRFRWVRIRWP